MLDIFCRFYFDFEQLEKIVAEKSIKLMIITNPLNPGGQRWTHSELKQLELALQVESSSY